MRVVLPRINDRPARWLHTPSTGSSAMPQIKPAPGPSCKICPCIEDRCIPCLLSRSPRRHYRAERGIARIIRDLHAASGRAKSLGTTGVLKLVRGSLQVRMPDTGSGATGKSPGPSPCITGPRRRKTCRPGSAGTGGGDTGQPTLILCELPLLRLGKVRVSTPLSYLALDLAASTSPGKVKLRKTFP